MKNIIDGFPKTAHPMGVLSSLTSALTAFNPKVVNVENEKEMYEAVCKTMGKFLVIATWTYRKMMGFPLNYYDNTKGYVENFLHLMFELPTGPYKINPVVVNALDKLFILHADHEQNCSTSTVRIVGSLDLQWSDKPTEEEVYESKKTTPKMKLFASLIGEGLSPPEAYRKAYDCTNSSNATIVANANKLLNDARIGLLLEPIYHAKKEMVIQDELAVRRFVMSELFTHAQEADGTGHKIKALELMGKAVGLFNDRSSEEHDDSADVEKLKAELRAKMASLLGVDDKKH
jgi:hypothetical protein